MRQIGVTPDEILSPDIDETPLKAEPPRAFARRMAREKLRPLPGAFALAADTVVAAGRRILPKAATREQAATCLKLLSGRRHRVYTAVAVAAPDGRVVERVSGSVVGFARLEAAQIAAYLESGEWEGKAGGYAIQGCAAGFIDFLSGSYSGVVGLPLYETAALLRGLGWR